MHNVKSGEFEGPLNLLLDLIEKRKLSINDVSLSEIADQYLEHIKQLQNFPVSEVAVFTVIASTLLLIKSKSLMPSLELTKEEESSIEDLEEKLKIYRRIRELSRHVHDRFNKKPLFAREAFKGMEIDFLEPRGVNTNSIYEILKNVLNNLPKPIQKLPQVAVKTMITLEEKITELLERITNKLEFSFSEFSTSRGKDIKTEIIVSFLAMLELVKQGNIMVNQENAFENINIKKI